MTEDKMVTVPRTDIEFVVQIANRNEWSREGDRLAALLSAPHKDTGGELEVTERCSPYQQHMVGSPEGKWVLYEDHAATVECLTREVDYWKVEADGERAKVGKRDSDIQRLESALTAREARVAEMREATTQLADAIKSGEELAVIGGLASDIAALASGEK